jgi:hypothetical protein
VEPATELSSLNPSPIHRNIRITRINDLIRVVTLDATVMASGSLSYLVGCGVASYYFKLSGQKRVQIMNIINSVDASFLRYFFIIERYEDII